MHPARKKEITTPALLVDLDKLEANINKMADFFQDKTANLRPMFKTPKCVPIAKMQIEVGAYGITCAKLSEAEVLVKGGIQDILIANQVVGPEKITRLVDIVKQSDVKCAVDDILQITALSEAASAAGIEIGVLIEINVGLPRCGVKPGNAVDLAKQIVAVPGLKLRGVMGYEGHLVFNEDREVRKIETEKAMTGLVKAAEAIREAGMPCEIVSGGGTGTYDITGVFPGITEVQAGSYVMMDIRYDKLDLGFEKAVTILSSVQSRALPGWAIIDAGIKVMSTDFGLPEPINLPGVKLAFLSEEHGSLNMEDTEVNLTIGDKIEFFPSHICTTINLHDHLYAFRKDVVEAVWPISGRGCSQ
jgi:D-serine deaminase-like pyridoxal phosphate-dependent protein